MPSKPLCKECAERPGSTAKLAEIAFVLGANGCDCECGCDTTGHTEDCEPCLACRISAIVLKKE